MNSRSLSNRWIALALIGCASISSAQTAPTQQADKKTSGGGVYRVGGGVSPPRILSSPEPEYSERARKAGYAGTCMLWLIVDPQGTPRDIKVARSIGMGLDEKAIEAVRQWRFAPAMKDGVPVAVMINVEVSFRLWSGAGTEFEKVSQKADAGDAEAQFAMAQVFLSSHDPDDESRGFPYLEKAAKQGLPKAQFAMADFLATRRNNPVEAYAWYALAQKSHFKHSDKRMKELAKRMPPEQLAEAQRRAETNQLP